MGFIRGEFDPAKLERIKAPLRTAWERVRRSAVPEPGEGPRDLPPPDPFRWVLVGAIVLLAGLALSLISIPVAAVLSRSVAGVNERIGGKATQRVVLPQIAQRSVVVARDGRTLAVLTGEQNRKLVSLAEVPPVAQQAVLAIEDARFYEHHGVDATGVLRAIFANTKAGGVREGGSTITQQLVKNTLVGTERTLDRKIKEARLAIQLEREVPKQRILELYLNEAYFGHGVYGIGAAAEFFYGKNVRSLQLHEAALLAGLISSPARYSPLDKPELARERRATVLSRMTELGNITEQQRRAAVAKPLGASRHALGKPAEPYFVEFVKQQILADERFGSTRNERIRALFEGGLRIETTLDVALQNAGKQAVSNVLDRPNDPSAALVSVEPSTGAIRAMVGGQDYDRSKYNLASAKRQPGSTFKPFALVAALDAGVPPTLTLDTPSPVTVKDPVTGEEYKDVQNYDEKGGGYMTLRRATELSVNSYYVQLTVRVGAKRIAETATRMGISSDVKPILSIALGTQVVSPLEMSGAYATIANGGVHCKPFGIARVVDGSGKTIVQNDPDCRRAIDPSVAAMASNVMQGVVTHGTGRRADIGRPAGGKTGTTENLGDAWYGGYTPQFSTIVWLGYKEGSSRPLRNVHGLPKVTGGSLPAEIWKRFMRVAHDGLPVEKFPAPPKVPQVEVPDVTGQSLADAKKALEAAGFTVKAEATPSTLAKDTVVSQTPVPKTKVDAGVLVVLKVSTGSESGAPPPPSSPSPSPAPSPSPSQSPSPSPTPSKKN